MEREAATRAQLEREHNAVVGRLQSETQAELERIQAEHEQRLG
jgi:hypothetical protein